MEQFTVEVTARRADGSHGPFRIYVGAPETTGSGDARCEVRIPLFRKPKWIIGETPRQAYQLAFDFIRRSVDYAGLVLEDARGNRFDLPKPPHEFEK